MKNIQEITSNYTSYQPVSNAENIEVTEHVIQLVNEITKRFEGIYQYTGNRTQEKTNLYKKEMTRALFQVKDKIDEKKVTDAINFFSVNGGSFAPSVPEFIQAVLGNNIEMIKPPEHVWFDPSKALPEFTPVEIQEFGKKGIALAREALKSSDK